MKILILTKKVPFPLTDGEVIAIHNLSIGLVNQGCEVHLLALNTQKHYVKYDAAIPELKHFKSVRTVDIDTRVKLWPALRSYISKRSYNIHRFVSEEFKRSLRTMLSSTDFDIVQLETLYLAPYISTIRKHSKAHIALRSHNVESLIWQNLAQRHKGLKGWYLQHCSDMLKQYENEVQGQYDMLLPITDLDAKYFRSRGERTPIKVVSVGLDLDKYELRPNSHKAYRLGFIGSLDWQPNLEGIDWFLTNVWARLKNDDRDIEFHIAGRNMPYSIKNLDYPDVTVYGEVDSAVAFMNSMDLILVPLFSGSGVRVKILEAMALGKIVLSTPKGYEGIGVTDKVNALVFNTAADLIQKLQELKELDSESLSEAARALIKQDFSTTALSRDLMEFYEEAIS